MFIQVTLQDKIYIHPSHKDKKLAVEEAIEQKYCNKYIPDQGLSIAIKNITKIISYQIIDGYLLADVIFDLILFKFFENEIITGKIISQDEDHIKISTPFCNIIIKEDDFMEDCEKVHIMPEGGTKTCLLWCWYYGNEKFYFKNNDKVRVRVKKVVEKPFTVYGSLNEQGLGPIDWWM